MQSNSTANLINLKGVFVNKVSHSDESIKLFISTKAKKAKCPVCGSETSKVHDYRNQLIKDLPITAKNVYLVLRKRRYACSCGKKFYEKYDFLPRYHRITNRLAAYICNELRKSVPLSFVAESSNVSVSTVMRLFDKVQYPKLSKLPEVLSIDEFKGNAETGKYQCILVDPKKKKVLDILPDRKQSCLVEYFSSIPRHERLKVKFFVCDMWNQYAEIARIFFPNATIIIDKYHFIRQVTWAIENVRKRIQKTMPASLRKYYKRSKSLILKRNHKLTEEEKQALDLMLLYNDDLRQAYILKESFHNICKIENYSEQRIEFLNWIKYAESVGIKEFESCIGALRNWHKEILNAFKYSFTNGPTEGYNNKIKVLKRISYGIKNFNRFRNRILHTC
ncbi:MAG: family transposase [Defluviitaleaceae bacterium]|nr:family transposase [Defluviitaleaceae bacterium]